MLKKWFTSIWFLALVITVPVILMLPPVFKKYEAKLVEQGNVGETDNFPQLYFEDIDSDGNKERIYSFCQPSDPKTFSFHYFNHNGGMIDQINFPVTFNRETSRLHFADFDSDGNKEAYTFAYQKDSLFLYWVRLTPGSDKINSIPIIKLNYYNDSLLNYEIPKIHCIDLDNDGQKELVFSVVGGFSYSPRQIIKVDIKNRKVTRSENTGCVDYNLQFEDLNGDGKMEIISDGATAPVRDWFNLPYNKPAPYLKVYNPDLSYFIRPIQFFEGIHSAIKTYVTESNGTKELFCTYLSSSSTGTPFRVYKINLQGEKTDSLVYEINDRYEAKYVFRNDKGNFVAQIKPNEFLEYSAGLKVVKIHKTKLPDDLNFICNQDINEDGKIELLFVDNTSKTIYLYSTQFKQQAAIHVDSQEAIKKVGKLQKNKFWFYTSKKYYIYSFGRNPYFIWRFPLFISLYLFMVFLVYLLQKIIESRIKEKYELKNQVRELQLQTFRNQLNPHFIFNTFNGVASVIKKGDNKKAYDVFMRFSKMMRTVLDNFNSDFYSLKQELDLITNYLELQKFRYKELFEYRINLESADCEEVQVPRLIVQVHVENAINHGLIPKGGGGILTISVSTEEEKLKIIIEDNGIGLKQSSMINSGKNGIGLKTLDELIAYINSENKNKINQEIIDLVDEDGVALGTKISIIIPSNLNIGQDIS